MVSHYNDHTYLRECCLSVLSCMDAYAELYSNVKSVTGQELQESRYTLICIFVIMHLFVARV